MNAIGWLLAASVLFVPAWGQWRGPGRDGHASVAPDPPSWPATLTRAWTVRVGAGYSTPLVAGDRVYVFTREGEDEVLRALDAATGRQLWRQSYPAPYTINPAAAGHGKGPKSTPVFSAARVYTLGIGGTVSAFDVREGRLLWRNEGKESPTFGTAQSPLLEDGLLIVHLGGHERGALTALDAATGSVRWSWTGDGPGYASPVVATFDGVRQVVAQTREKLVGVSLDRGQLLWQVPFTTAYEQNSVTPLVIGDLVIYSGLDKGVHAGRVVRRGAGWALEKQWENPEVAFYMSSPVAEGGVLYGFSHKRKGEFVALDLATGRLRWRSEGRRGDNASLVLAPKALFLLTTEGELVVAPKGGERFAPLATYTVASSPTWAHLAMAGTGFVVKDAEGVALWRP
jgi:outer membrane protein assembly factor BamB